MNKNAQLAFALVCLVGGMAFAIFMGKWAAYQGSKRPCDSGLSASTLQEKYGVVVPDDVRICRDTNTKANAEKSFQFVSASPSVLCLVSFELIGCPSLAKEGLRWTVAMGKEWDSEGSDKGSGDHLSMSFRRKGGSARVSLSKMNHSEIIGDLYVSGGKGEGGSSGSKGKKGGHGGDGDDD